MSEGSPRPPRSIRIYLGCSAAFVSLFLVLGLFVMVAVALGDAPDKRPALFGGAVFAAVGAGGLFLVRWVWKQSGLREERRQRAPDQPWAWGQDLSGGVVQGTSPVATVVVWIVFAGFWLGMMTVMTVLGWDKMREEPGLMAVLGVFWLAGLFLASMAVTAVLHARRFGRSTLALDGVPARLGGWLSGVVRAPAVVHGADIRLSVECIQTSSSSGRSGSRSTWTLWRDTKVIDGTRCEREADRVAIPFALRLPLSEDVDREQRASVLGSLLPGGPSRLLGEDIDWYVEVKASLPGVDYSERFTVPVAPPEAGAAPVPAAPPRAMPELAGERLAARLPGRLEHDLGADVFVFPVKPLWVAWVVIPGALALACLVQLMGGALPLPEAIGSGALVWTGAIAGGLGAVCLLGLMLDTRRIEVAPDAVRVRRGLLGLGFHRTIPRAAIATVVEEATKSNPPTYSVDIRLHDGTTYWAAISLPEPEQAKALAERLRQILLPETPEPRR